MNDSAAADDNRTGETLDQACQVLREMVENTQTSLVYLDRDFNFVAVNSRYAETCRKSCEDLVGRNHFALYPHPENEAIFRRCRDTGNTVVFRDKPFVFPDQPERGVTYWDWKLTPVKNASGGIDGFVLSLVETTERKMAELSLLAANSELERVNAVNAARLRLYDYADSHTLDEILEETLNEGERLTNSCIGFYHFVERDQVNLALQNWSTRTKAEFCQAAGKGLHYPITAAGVWVDCVRQMRPVIHNDYESLPHRKGLPEGHAPVIRELVVPVIRDRRVRAILGVGNKREDYTDEDLRVVSLLADLAWDIVEHKRTEEALRLSERRFHTAFDHAPIGMALVSPEGQCLRVNRAVCSMLGYSEDRLLETSLQELTHPGDTETEFYHREQVLSGDTDTYEVEKRYLHRSGRIVWVTQGVTLVRNHAGDPVYFVSQIEDITERKLAEERQRQESERNHRIATVLQQALIPSQIPSELPGYDIAARYIPALLEAEVCGDFYDIFTLEDGKIGIVIGDVIGKGLSAATRVAAAKHTVRGYAFLDDSPRRVVAHTNEALLRSIDYEDGLITAFYATLDTSSDTLTYTNAGHVPPLIIRADGSVEALSIGGPMFHGLDGNTYAESSAVLDAGASLLLVTDGVTEARKPGCADQFGQEGVVLSVRKSSCVTAEEIADAVLEDAAAFAGGRLRDDAVVLVIKREERDGSRTGAAG